GTLVSRARAVQKAFGFARMLRDRWQAWPARVGPLLAAQFELDAGAVTVVLEGYVREHLEELASERCEFSGIAPLVACGPPCVASSRTGGVVGAAPALVPLVKVADALPRILHSLVIVVDGTLTNLPRESELRTALRCGVKEPGYRVP